MDNHFQAVYENGVLRPLELLALDEHELVSLSILRAQANGSTPETEAEQQSLQQRNVLLAFIAKMEAMPDAAPPDGFSNRDHDRLIYGS